MNSFFTAVHIGAGVTVGIVCAIGVLSAVAKIATAVGLFPLPF